jgi:serine protease
MKTFFTHISFLILLNLILTDSIAAQQSLNYMPGEYLIQLESDKDIHSLIKENFQTGIQTFTFTPVEKVSKNFNIWLLRTSGDIPTTSEVLELLQTWKGVKIAQKNHVGSYREKIPNDVDFNRQWFFKNTGQDDGKPGADIKATEAWEIATGGLTMFGDTIVVAVIDYGFEAGHADLEENMWYNHAEIPDNGIDDDNNGYVDDYYGWNATDSTGNIYSSQSHGMLVNGMVGARGNNELGVTGINWNVKIMNVSLRGIVESNVIKAYDYVLSHRKLYNETNGEKGAFVVATNSSWGIDEGDPSKAPLWCNFYDSLGVHGILSCGATANFNFNVDVVGDLPTACASDYLISVTSSTRNDIKSTAGFGKTTIDLAAPGQSIYSTTRQSSYSGSSGTSFASPLVAGMIGLLYSVECKGFQEMVKRNPGEAALLIKEVILSSVDPLPSFANNTVSGGRLNALNAMNVLLTQCRSCPQPDAPELFEVSPNSMVIQWPDNDLYESFVVRYRVEGAVDWEEVVINGNIITLNDLLSCTVYEVDVQGVCVDENSEPSESRFFETEGCCEPPTGLDTIFVQPNTARIKWESVLPAEAYIFEYKREADNIWNAVESQDTQELIRFLDFCTVYQVRVATICINDTTDFSPVFEFRTKGCGSCTEKVHCEVPIGNNDLKYISRVSINNIDITSDAGPGAYESFTAEDAFALEVGLSYPIEIEFAGQDSASPIDIRAWLDYNHDAIFDEEEEVVVSRDSFDNLVLSETLNIATRGRIGTTRLRIAILDTDMNDSLPVACPQAGFTGDYEDYCITLVQRNCPRAPELDTVMVGFTSIGFEWDKAPAIIGFTHRFKKSSDTEWMEEVSDTATSVSFTGLTMCEFYDFEIRTICEFDTTQFQRLTIQTMCPTSTREINSDELTVELYPNPVNDFLLINAFSPDSKSITLTLYSLTRSVLMQKQEKLTQGQTDIQWHGLSKLTPGMYILNIQTEKGILSRKIVKQ